MLNSITMITMFIIYGLVWKEICLYVGKHLCITLACKTKRNTSSTHTRKHTHIIFGQPDTSSLGTLKLRKCTFDLSFTFTNGEYSRKVGLRSKVTSMAFGHYNKMFVSVTMSIQNEQLINIPFLAPQNHLYRIEKCWIFAAACCCCCWEFFCENGVYLYVMYINL